MLEIKTIFKKGALIISLGGELVEGTIKDLDKIIVVDNGKIVGQGKHEELLKKNGFYHNLYYSQFEKPE